MTKVETKKITSLPDNLSWRDVDSSNVQSVAYESESKTLYVQFKNGGLYSYHEVSLEIFEGIFTVESVGKYLNTYVKPAFSYKKIA